MKEENGKHLAKEFDVFDVTGQRTANINLRLDALKSIPCKKTADKTERPQRGPTLSSKIVLQ